MSDIVISGYYGLGNSGDEALLESIINDLKKIDPDISITALSGNTKLTSERYGVKTVNRYNPFSVINEIRNAKMLISGGGTLIQDATSTKSLLYYLGIIEIAKFYKLKTMMYANGMGPIKEKNINKVHKVVNKVDLITLREDSSLEEIKRCRIDKPEIIVTADPAFNLEPAPNDEIDKIFNEFNIPGDKKLIAVSCREWKNADKDFIKKMSRSLDKLSEEGYFSIFLPMQIKKDFNISREISENMNSESVVLNREISVSELFGVIKRCNITCGMRLHILIFSSCVCVPMVGIVYDPKVKGFMQYLSQTDYVNVCDFNEEKFIELLRNCEKDNPERKKFLKEKSEELRKKATENAILAINLLNKKEKK